MKRFTKFKRRKRTTRFGGASRAVISALALLAVLLGGGSLANGDAGVSASSDSGVAYNVGGSAVTDDNSSVLGEVDIVETAATYGVVEKGKLFAIEGGYYYFKTGPGTTIALLNTSGLRPELNKCYRVTWASDTGRVQDRRMTTISLRSCS